MSAHKFEIPLRLDSIFYYISANLDIKTQKELSVELSFSETPSRPAAVPRYTSKCGPRVALTRPIRRHSNPEVSIDPSANCTANKCPVELNTEIGREHHQSSLQLCVCPNAFHTNMPNMFVM